jgi:hypothetical protein
LSLSESGGKEPAKRQTCYYDLSVFIHYRVPEVSVLEGEPNTITGPSDLKPPGSIKEVKRGRIELTGENRFDPFFYKASTRAYARIIDEVNKHDLSVFQRPEEPVP